MSEQRNIDAETPFYVAGWLVDPATCRIAKEGEQHKIEPKAMTVLLCLAQQQGQVVSREVLEEKAWPDMVVGYDSLASAIKHLAITPKTRRLSKRCPKKVTALSARLVADQHHSHRVMKAVTARQHAVIHIQRRLLQI